MKNILCNDPSVFAWELNLPEKVKSLVASGNRVLIKKRDGTILGAIVPYESLVILEEFDKVQEDIDSKVVQDSTRSIEEILDWEDVKDSI